MVHFNRTNSEYNNSADIAEVSNDPMYNSKREADLRPLTFDVSDDDHDEEAVVVGMVSMVNTRCDLACADNFLQGDQHQFDRQESHTFIEEVQRAVKDKVPAVVLGRRERKDVSSRHIQLLLRPASFKKTFLGLLKIYYY